MKMLFLLLITFFISPETSASDWKTIHHDDSSVHLSVSFKREKRASAEVAAPLHFNVSGVSPESRVRLVLHSLMSYHQKVQKTAYVLDLALQPEGHFWKEFSEAKKMAFDDEIPLNPEERSLVIHEQLPTGDCIFYMQEIRLIIDGNELKPLRVNFWQI